MRKRNQHVVPYGIHWGRLKLVIVNGRYRLGEGWDAGGDPRRENLHNDGVDVSKEIDRSDRPTASSSDASSPM